MATTIRFTDTELENATDFAARHAVDQPDNRGISQSPEEHKRNLWDGNIATAVKEIFMKKMLTLLLVLCVFVCGCSDERLSQPMEVMFFGTPHNLGYRSIPYAEEYWLRDGTLKHYDWGNIVLTLERMEGM